MRGGVICGTVIGTHQYSRDLARWHGNSMSDKVKRNTDRAAESSAFRVEIIIVSSHTIDDASVLSTGRILKTSLGKD